MNKITKWLFAGWLSMVTIILVIQGLFALSHTNHGDEVIWQLRTPKIENGKSVFNFWVLISPLQVTAFAKKSFTETFKERFIFPVSNAVPSSEGPRFVHGKIKKLIEHKTLLFNRKYDYDNQCFKVLEASGYVFPKLAKPKVDVLINTTSSPEFVKNGFEQSIQINTIEPENVKLSQDRLDNTYQLLSSDTAKLHFHLTKGKASELQLKDANEVKKVISNPSLLKNMRYAEIIGTVSGETLTVTPFTLPLLPFLWIPLLYLLYQWLKSINWKRNTQPKVAPVKKAEPKIIDVEPIQEADSFNLWPWLIGFGISALLWYYLGPWRAWGVLAILLLAYGLYRLFEKWNVISYVRQPEPDTENKITMPWWCWAIFILIFVGCAFILIGCALYKLLCLYELVRWLLFIILVSIATYVLYFYRERIKSWFSGWRIPKWQFTRFKISKSDLSVFRSVLLTLAFLFILGVVLFLFGMKTFLWILIAIILVCIFLVWYLLPIEAKQQFASIIELYRIMFIGWWNRIPTCRKVLFAFILFIIISRFLGWWIWTGPWFW